MKPNVSSTPSCLSSQFLINLDDPELLAGAPAGLQIVAPKWGDEQLLADVEVIDLALNGKPAGEAASSSGAPKL